MPDNVKRRRFLKSMGVGASALATLPGVSVASPDHREEVLEHEAVRRILDELDNPDITGAIRRELKITEENQGEVEYDERSVRNVPDITVTSMETDIGRLVYGQYGEDSTVIQFHLDAGQDVASSSYEIPKRYSGIPEDGKGILLLDGDNQMDKIEFLRTVTESETEAVASTLKTAPTNTKVLYNSSLGHSGAYEAHVESPSVTGSMSTDQEETYVVEPAKSGYGTDNDMNTADINGTDSDITIADISTFDEGDISPLLNDCETWVSACLGSITTTSTCAMACISVGVGNIPGALVCITCWMGSHATVPLACAKAVQNC